MVHKDKVKYVGYGSTVLPDEIKPVDLKTEVEEIDISENKI